MRAYRTRLPITSSSPVVMARSCVCCLLSMPAIARLWLATSAGISGEMVRDLMVACVEQFKSQPFRDLHCKRRERVPWRPGHLGE